MSLILPAILGALVLSAIGMGSDADEDPDDDTGEDDGGDSGETITLGAATGSPFVGGDGNDTISVNVEGSTPLDFLMEDLSANASDNTHFEVRGGMGDDLLSLSGEGYIARGDEGNDLIDLGDASYVGVSAGMGDTVVGGSGESVFVSLSGDAFFQGGDGSDYVQSSSTSDTRLGGSNDTFIGVIHTGMPSDAFPELVSGDEGDDILIGGISEFHLTWAHANDQGLVSHSQQVLDGGAGDDTIIGSHGDTLVGGVGEDQFEVVMNESSDSEPVVVPDFVRGQDSIELRYGSGDGYDFDGSFQDSITHASFQLEETADGDTLILASPDTVLLRLVGVTGLTVGVSEWDPETSSYQSVDLSGNPVLVQSCDVHICGHSNLTDI